MLIRLPKINLKKIMVYFLTIVFIFGIFKAIEAVRAGTLNPSAAPAATMYSLEDIYNRLAGTYDASGVTANGNGTVLQQLKAIKNRMGM